MATSKAPKISEKEKKTFDYMGEQFKRSPEYAKKQFGVKPGMKTKLPKKSAGK